MFLIVHSYVFFAMFHSLVLLQRYIEAPLFRTDLTTSHLFLDRVHVLGTCVSTGVMSTLYINILFFIYIYIYNFFFGGGGGQVGPQMLSQSMETPVCG